MSNKVRAVVIGAQKCGTSALWEILSQHPELACHSAGQFPRFYDSESPLEELERAMGENFTESQLENKVPVIRDTTIGLEGKEIPNILGYLPDTKVILLVRDHVERCYSAFVYATNKGFENDYSDFDSMLDAWEAGNYVARKPPLLNYIEAGMYGATAEKAVEAVGRENLMVLRADELRNNQNETCARLFEFLSVGYIEIPETIANITGDSRIPFLNKMMRSCLLYTSPSPRDQRGSRMPSSA